ncbi:hypothetical protein [Paenibacillus lutimineralis]|uniref:hypothetical protein n=1 Tax=Paenibacillus lutimineralis TaxID=2707005 RepID=UPI0013A610E5|nr:hypothetical protein [Paenibacillus lutimineralis]
MGSGYCSGAASWSIYGQGQSLFYVAVVTASRTLCQVGTSHVTASLKVTFISMTATMRRHNGRWELR